MENGELSRNKSVCVIGAGTAGLCALRHALGHGMDAVAYEQCSALGGTWVYSDNTDAECEEDIHSSMYTGLRTNLPKEVMGFPDYPYPDSIEESFISAEHVLKFLQDYAQHYELLPHIMFRHEVIRVRPLYGAWEVYVRDIETDNYTVLHYDFVFVCNGHYTRPQYPEILGMDEFKGTKLHSHLYRKPDMFKDKTVVVIGAGPSGVDIANHISATAKRIFLSHHLHPAPSTSYMGNVTQKPDVRRFTATEAIFQDDTREPIDCIVFCTGYQYAFPFLSSACEMRSIDNCVYPLYKHCINISYPSMALIGLPFYVCPSQLFDLQVRFALKFYTHQKKLPSQQQMMADLEKDVRERKASGLSKRQAHQMGDRQFAYYKALAELADIENIKPVIGKMMQDCSQKYIFELETYRDNCYRVLDDENFVKFIRPAK